jgi:hypothetical protein
MEGIRIPLGLFIAWVIVHSLWDRIADWNDNKPSVIERFERKVAERQAEEELRYNSPEAVVERRKIRAQEYRNYKKPLSQKT